MFDALQQLQEQERNADDKKLKNPPPFSYLKFMKNVRTSDYEVIYGKSTIRNSHLERE